MWKKCVQQPNPKKPSKYILHTNVRTSFSNIFTFPPGNQKPPKKPYKIIRALSQIPPTRPPMGKIRGAEDVKCHQLVKSNRKNHIVASETEDLAFFTMVGLLGGLPHWSHVFFVVVFFWFSGWKEWWTGDIIMTFQWSRVPPKEKQPLGWWWLM